MTRTELIKSLKFSDLSFHYHDYGRDTWKSIIVSPLGFAGSGEFLSEAIKSVLEVLKINAAYYVQNNICTDPNDWAHFVYSHWKDIDQFVKLNRIKD